jgi:hypothetical protein
MRALAVCALALGGCLSHMPPAGYKHMQINWAATFDDAAVRARVEQKPILACLIAGEIQGLC